MYTHVGLYHYYYTLRKLSFRHTLHYVSQLPADHRTPKSNFKKISFLSLLQYWDSIFVCISFFCALNET